MPPPVPVDLPPPIPLAAPVEHVWTLDEFGRPIEVEQVIHIAPRDAEQFQYDFQPDLFRKLLRAITEEDLDTIVQVIEFLPESFRKQTKKLFAEVGELKKKNYQLQLKNDSMQEQIDFLYHELNIKKRGFNDLCNFCSD